MRIIIIIVLTFLKLLLNKPIESKPNNFISELQIKSNEKLLFESYTKYFKPNHFYKIMVHYLGSVRIL
jgi:hypothetical protein